jgi:hypothetical protein
MIGYVLSSSFGPPARHHKVLLELRDELVAPSYRELAEVYVRYGLGLGARHWGHISVIAPHRHSRTSTDSQS